VRSEKGIVYGTVGFHFPGFTLKGTMARLRGNDGKELVCPPAPAGGRSTVLFFIFLIMC
jgi:hypothetical protein